MIPLKDRYFTVSQAAAELKVSRQTVSHWIKEGKLTAERIGREALIEKVEVERVGDEMNREMLMAQFVRTIRRRCYYTKDDKIEEIAPRGRCLRFRVTRSDGVQQMVRLPFDEISFVEDEKGMLVNIGVQIGKIRSPKTKQEQLPEKAAPVP